MGCDIHGWVEAKVDGKWVAVKELADRKRNYWRFADLAGVRNYNNRSDAVPLGVPEDVSDTARYNINYWGVDGHSHSYLPLKEAAQIFLHSVENPDIFQKEYPESAFFDIEEDDTENMRLVFWFDN